MKSVIGIFAIFMITVSSVLAQNNTIKKEKFFWGNGTQDTTAGYTQAVRVGDFIYISGTVARDVNPEGIRRLYQGLEKTLQFYGAGFQHVVKENLYTTDIEAMKQYNEARKAFYNNDYPAATWVQVARLYMPDARLEVELVAYFPEKK